jgi:hypothetical protein
MQDLREELTQRAREVSGTIRIGRSQCSPGPIQGDQKVRIEI